MTMNMDARESERQFIKQLQSKYEEAGYEFVAYPDSRRLPDFMRGYEPDAIALKGDQRVAIEVKNRRSPNADMSVRRIRKFFEGHQDWQFRVIFINDEPQNTTVAKSSPELIHRRLSDVQALLKLGQGRAAFLMAWSLLEAIAHFVEPEIGGRPYSPGTIVQSLAMNGHIDPDTEKKLRSLINLRNGIVHGDLEVEPKSPDIEVITRTIDHILKSHGH